jgi:hypothetical protein
MSSGKEVPTPTDDLAKRLDRLEEMMRSLTGTVHDISQQHQGLSVAVIRLEQQVFGAAGHAPPPPAPQDATNVMPPGASASNSSVAPQHQADPLPPPPPPHAPHHRCHGPEDESEEGDFLPTYHKLDFLKFDGSGDPLPWVNHCEHYFHIRTLFSSSFDS